MNTIITKNNKMNFEFSSIKIEMLGKSVDEFPQFLGSMIRGSFGRTLKQTFCAMHHGNCDKCMLSNSCGYYLVFHSINLSKSNAGFRFMPHPFVIRQAEVSGSDNMFCLQWEINLFGIALKYIPYFVLAFDIMGKRGFGKKRIPFKLNKVKCNLSSTDLYSISNNKLLKPQVKLLSEYVNEKVANWNTSSVVIKFVSPLKIIVKGKQIYSLDYNKLILAMKRRILFIQEEYAKESKNSNNLIDKGKNKFHIISENKIRYTSYSSRQKKRIELRGFIGEYRIDDVSPALLELLFASSVLHLGKNTSFGMGQFNIEKTKRDS